MSRAGDDEDLVARVHDGDERALGVLLHRYRPVARARARRAFLIGAETQDLEQECLIAVYEAARDFRPDRGTAFASFAEVCMARQVATAVRTAAREKHQPLNRAVPLALGDQHSSAAALVAPGPLGRDPAAQVVAHESRRELGRLLAQVLSVLEVQVLGRYLDGCSYGDIGAELGQGAKAVDNALYRIRRKLRYPGSRPAWGEAAAPARLSRRPGGARPTPPSTATPLGHRAGNRP
ncbi:MAG TPA: sigma-70 family RNA polymerase sigma factor [Acidimicrobiales bacterium]|nr:sigma-70 family RNA polymerase sigma factor [Acidimicrobiales bacterium]